MEHRITLEGLSGVPRTLLLPLRGRYLETKRDDGIIRDPKSVEIVESIEDDFLEADLPWDGQIMISVRTEILDELTRGFLAQHPDSVVVNLGCGLDTRFQRVDNGRVTWYDLDLPEAIELRKNFFTESDRHIFISKSVFDTSWAELVPKDKRVLLIAEGLLYYFAEEQVKSIFMGLKEHFPGSDFLFEAFSGLIKRSWHRGRVVRNTFSMFKWGLDNPKSLEKWGKDISFIEQWPYFARHPKRWGWISLLRFVPVVRNAMKIVHVRFSGTPALN